MALDKPIFRAYPDVPVPVTAGACIITDPECTSPWAFALLSESELYRVNLNSGASQLMPPPPGGLEFGAGVTGLWDGSRGAAGRVYFFGPGTGGGVDTWWHHFDVATLAWDVGGAPNTATLDGLLGAAWGTDAALAHPCSSLATVPSDDYIYLTGNNGTVFYRYDITEPVGTEWVVMGARLVAAGAGCTLVWAPDLSVNNLYSVDGGGLASDEYYSITGDAWAVVAPAPIPPWDLPTTGTCSVTAGDGQSIYVRLSGTGTVLQYWPATGATAPVAQLSDALLSDGVTNPSVGRKMSLWYANGRDVLVMLVNGTTYLQSIQLPEA